MSPTTNRRTCSTTLDTQLRGPNGSDRHQGNTRDGEGLYSLVERPVRDWYGGPSPSWTPWFQSLNRFGSTSDCLSGRFSVYGYRVKVSGPRDIHVHALLPTGPRRRFLPQCLHLSFLLGDTPSEVPLQITTYSGPSNCLIILRPPPKSPRPSVRYITSSSLRAIRSETREPRPVLGPSRTSSPPYPTPAVNLLPCETSRLPLTSLEGLHLRSILPPRPHSYTLS